jgi:Holliday junction resolvase-like predicted endonuclease
MKSHLRKKGDWGEKIAEKFLMKLGFTLIERNYLRPMGEIDLVFKKDDVHHFVEVKTHIVPDDVIHETDSYNIEENFHSSKRRKMLNVIKCYISEHQPIKWQIDLMAITIYGNGRNRVKVRYWPEIVF